MNANLETTIKGAGRIVFAKLTTDGSYDVVAHTQNVGLDTARSLAESVQLGNVSPDIIQEPVFAYLRPQAGGHLVVKYVKYDWLDQHGRASIMTDIVWLDAAAFASLRCNPYNVIFHESQTYESRVVLPDVVLPQYDAKSELDRLRELSPNAGELLNFISAVVESDSLLVIDPAGRRAQLELVFLALPVTLRPALTFHERAFQPPSPRPRITIADVAHPGLRMVPWDRELPEDTAGLPLQPAEGLIKLLAAPERLLRAHSIYASLEPSGGSLREEMIRLTRVSDFDTALEKKRLRDAVRSMSALGDGDYDRLLPELEAGFGLETLAQGITSLLSDGPKHMHDVARIFAAAKRTGSRALRSLSEAAADWQFSSGGELVDGGVANRIVEGLGDREPIDADRIVRFATITRKRLASSHYSPPPRWAAVSDFVRLQLSRDSHPPLTRAKEILQTASPVTAILTSGEARAEVERACSDAVEQAVRSAKIKLAEINALIDVQNAARAVAITGWSEHIHHDLLTAEFVQRGKKDVQRAIEQIEATYGGAALAPLATALILRSQNASSETTNSDVSSAAIALTRVDLSLRKQVAFELERGGIGELQLRDNPAYEAVLPLLGYSSSQGALGHRISRGVASFFGGDPSGVGEIAVAVSELRNQHKKIGVSDAALTAIVGEIAKQPNAKFVWKADMIIELLAPVCEPLALSRLEEAVDASPYGMTVRLQRLDRAILQCEEACDEQLYRSLTRVLSDNPQISRSAQHRLRKALGITSIRGLVFSAVRNVLPQGNAS